MSGTGDFAAVLNRALRAHGKTTALQIIDIAGAIKSVTFDSLASKADAFADVFKQKLSGAQSVGIFMRRSDDHVAAIVGAIQTGALFYSINPTVSAVQILQMAQRAQTRILLCDNSTLLKLAPLADADLGGLEIVHLHDGPLNAAQENALSKLLNKLNITSCHCISELSEIGANAHELSQADPMQLLFTSGSTGVPRGVGLKSTDIVDRVNAEIDAYRITSDDRLLNVLPFSFDVGCNQLYTSLISGSTLVMLNSWLPKDIIAALHSHDITGFSGVPSLWHSLLAGDGDMLRSACACLRYLTISGGSLSKADQIQLRATLKHVDFYKTYGQTETFRSAMLMPADFDRKPSSVGQPPPGVLIGIMRPDGTQADPGETGEIIHSGVGTMSGYFGLPDGVNGLRSGPDWLGTNIEPVVFTGDRGALDADGFLTISGRMDRMLKIRGNRVYPEEVEAQLLTLSGVAEAVVLAGDKADSLKAVLRCTGHTALTALDVMRALATKLPSYMIPTQVETVEAFPRTATGKVDFAALAQTAPQKREKQTA